MEEYLIQTTAIQWLDVPKTQLLAAINCLDWRGVVNIWFTELGEIQFLLSTMSRRQSFGTNMPEQ